MPTSQPDVRHTGGLSVSPPSRPSSAARSGGRRRVAGERSRPRPSAPADDAVDADSVDADSVDAAAALQGSAVPTRGENPTLARASKGGEVTTCAVPVTGGAGESADDGERRVVPTWLLVVLAALLVVVAAGLAGLVVVERRGAAVEVARGEALRAARSAAVPLLSYDYRRLDADFAAGLRLTTSPFREQYARTTANAVRKVATDTKATVRAEVASAGVVRATAAEVTVLLFVNQTTTSSRVQRPQVDQNRVEMTLVEKKGRWLVSQVRGL